MTPFFHCPRNLMLLWQLYFDGHVLSNYFQLFCIFILPTGRILQLFFVTFTCLGYFITALFYFIWFLSVLYQFHVAQNEMMWTAGIQMNWVCDHRSESQLKQLWKSPLKPRNPFFHCDGHILNSVSCCLRFWRNWEMLSEMQDQLGWPQFRNHLTSTSSSHFVDQKVLPSKFHCLALIIADLELWRGAAL